MKYNNSIKYKPNSKIGFAMICTIILTNIITRKNV